MQKIKPVGQTVSAGFQVGVRRTFPITVENAWNLITSTIGITTWLGELPAFSIQVGQQYLTEDGVSGNIRVVNQFQNIRLTWKKENWIKPTILQIRTIPNGDKTTLSFHQENLSDMNVREEMKLRWEEVLNKLSEII
ncbi:SRPBCC domain-containing protein [Cohnella pontilimi]|uniref:SRPBCC domain-containing protein n=1 Tax=Cohnella pontilimi TaxID=2564100 RepID=A0A4U0FHE7_9BACL|nr:SRPBCC domain-containing protein [Cohnella pontilimi]TJY43844.1 SRPBCC domain-containing protein [Cohnella pontilimi]